MAATIPQPRDAVYRASLRLRLRDLRLPLRYLALDPLPHTHLRKRRAVVAGTLLQLVEQRARLLQALARSLRGTPDIIVAGLLGLDPRLLDVRDEQHDTLDLAVEVRLPLLGRGE